MFIERAVGFLARPAPEEELAFRKHLRKSQQQLGPRLNATLGVC
jgi:hypothetical protein